MSQDREPTVSARTGRAPYRAAGGGCAGCLLALVVGPLWLVLLLLALVSDDVVGLALQVRWPLSSSEPPSWTEADVPAGTPMSIATARPNNWSCSIRQADGTWAPARWRDTGFWTSGDEKVYTFRAPTSPVAVRCVDSGKKPGAIALWRDDADGDRMTAYRIGTPLAGLAWMAVVTVVLFGPWVWIARRRRRKRLAAGGYAPSR